MSDILIDITDFAVVANASTDCTFQIQTPATLYLSDAGQPKVGHPVCIKNTSGSDVTITPEAHNGNPAVYLNQSDSVTYNLVSGHGILINGMYKNGTSTPSWEIVGAY
jgi:hypothetical protein